MLHTDLSRNTLRQVFEDHCLQAHAGVPGVLRIDGPAPGPSLGILAMTHGNEPAGLAAFYTLLQAQTLQQQLRCGRVYLILNNLAAGRRYFEEAQDLSFTAHYRFVDQDMNRMPEPVQGELAGDSSEIRRARELLPIYAELDAVLDLHSTSAPSAPMLIEIDPEQSPLQVPGVNVMLRGILDHLIGKALVSLCGQAKGYVLECGSHEEPASLLIAQEAAWRLLEQLDMVMPRPHAPSPLTIYQIYRAIIFPDESYQLQRILHSFECLPAGTLLAEGEGQPIVIDRESWVIMPPPRLKPVHPGSEFLYLASRETS
ncbi:MAG: hypothetical protein CVV27_14735 [Candidatus Melainabacteria bacterium HGW-Melainabacteria-1]|nr:MAG: hypothetical protein CVV27_14735 [Candidatus Melainabacteria bacterium HGW-Melainabacteria-1]